MHRRLVLAEREVAPDLVDDLDVAALPGELRAGVVHHRAGRIPGLRGEADDDRTLAPSLTPPVHEAPHDVRVLDELDSQARVRVGGLLDLAVADADRAEVG